MQPPDPAPLPATYRRAFAEAVRKFALMRPTDEALAQYFGVSLETLQEWLASVPEFAEAVRYGRQGADAEVVDRLYESAVGLVHEVVERSAGAGKEPVFHIRHRPPNKAAWNFWRANRLPGEGCQPMGIAPERRFAEAGKPTRSEPERLMMEAAAARRSTPHG